MTHLLLNINGLVRFAGGRSADDLKTCVSHEPLSQRCDDLQYEKQRRET
jgi:hypothetical protein